MEKSELASRFNPQVADALREYTRSSPFAGQLGIEIVSSSPGRLTCQLIVEERHHSGVGAVHGGVIVSLIDHAMSLAVYPLVEIGKWVATLEFKVSYLEAVREGTMVAEAEVLSLKKRVGTVRVEVKNGDALAATAIGTVYIREKPS